MDPALETKLKGLPEGPGVYLFKDRSGGILYIGKAASLRKRVASYFPSFAKASEGRQPGRPRSAKLDRLIRQTRDLDWITTGSEAEALLVEAGLIKESRPKYNVALRDDKSYPYLKVSVEEAFPRLTIGRGTREIGVKAIGPFADAALLRRAVGAIRRVIPFRTCRVMPKRACLDYHLGLCPAPCEGRITPAEYQACLSEVFRIAEGRKQEVLEALQARMRQAARERRYEDAARYRDQVEGLLHFSVRPRRIIPAEALADLMSLLRLPRLPRRIEGFDVSNIYGRQAVGSLAAFQDGKPFKDGYRRFKIRTVPGMDDYAMMREIVRRRFSEDWPHPDLLVIDGGRGHLNAALKVLKELRLDLPAVGIAKEFEQIFLPRRSEPLLLPPESRALQLLQRIRDEAHRFAVGYHRLLRGARALRSALDEIPGVGPRRRKDLLVRFESVAAIRQATAEDLLQVRGISRALAERILQHLKR